MIRLSSALSKFLTRQTMLYLATFVALSSITAVLSLQSQLQKKSVAFGIFQKQYLSVLSIVLLSDWLQGSYQYSLYKSYGYSLTEIAHFFILGFSSSALIGTFIGSICDFIGRKNGSLLYCCLNFLSCVTKLSPQKEWILVGRFLGGISTSLLFSVFEAWMISQHKAKGFPMEWLDDTFQWATFLNGLVAILSGIMANLAVDQFGLIAPFLIAALCCAFAFVMIFMRWEDAQMAGTPSELDTHHDGMKEDFPDTKRVTRSMAKQMKDSPKKELGITKDTKRMSTQSTFSTIFSQWDLGLTLLGLLQTLFEASMYIFVFLWSPVLEHSSTTLPPFGLIFSTFMVCIMLGSFFFKYLRSKNVSFATILCLVFVFATISFFIPMFTKVSLFN
jgi:MFS transporter, MFS domain-containing protein family, molybdate-anion transporter